MRRIRFDPEACTGCRACQMACLDQRDIRCAEGQAPLRFMTCRVEQNRILWKSVGCVHCGKCMQVCPEKAIARDSETGYVLLDAERCTGCGACVKSCPLHVISVDPGTGRSVKCDGCYARVTMGMLPACVHTCPTGALSLED